MKHNTCALSGPCPFFSAHEEDCEDCRHRKSAPRKPNKNGWTPESELLLVRLIDGGETFTQAASRLDKTATACYHKYYRIKRKQREMLRAGVTA